jgi:hypothetical protein
VENIRVSSETAGLLTSNVQTKNHHHKISDRKYNCPQYVVSENVKMRILVEKYPNQFLLDPLAWSSRCILALQYLFQCTDNFFEIDPMTFYQ